MELQTGLDWKGPYSSSCSKPYLAQSSIQPGWENHIWWKISLEDLPLLLDLLALNKRSLWETPHSVWSVRRKEDPAPLLSVWAVIDSSCRSRARNTCDSGCLCASQCPGRAWRCSHSPCMLHSTAHCQWWHLTELSMAEVLPITEKDWDWCTQGTDKTTQSQSPSWCDENQPSLHWSR